MYKIVYNGFNGPIVLQLWSYCWAVYAAFNGTWVFMLWHLLLIIGIEKLMPPKQPVFSFVKA